MKKKKLPVIFIRITMATSEKRSFYYPKNWLKDTISKHKIHTRTRNKWNESSDINHDTLDPKKKALRNNNE